MTPLTNHALVYCAPTRRGAAGGIDASRLRFCATVRSRLPTLAILAVGTEPQRAVAFDGFGLPLSSHVVPR